MSRISNSHTVQVVAASMPAWAAALSVGQWYAIPGTNLSSVDPNPAIVPVPNRGGYEGPSAKVFDWNGMCVDPVTSHLYSAANGGHYGYAGNEVDRLELNRASPIWVERLASTPSNLLQEAVSYYPDGKPTSRHSYYGHVFRPVSRHVMLFGGAWFNLGGGFHAATSSYNVDTNAYTAAGTYPNIPTHADNAGIPSYTVDPRNDDIYALGYFAMSRLSGATNTWATVSPTGASVPWGYKIASAFDTTRNRIFYVGSDGTNTARHHYDVATNVLTQVTLSGAAASAVQSEGQAGMEYIPSPVDAFVMRPDVAGGTLYKINASTFECTAISTTGGSGIPIVANGVFGKFSYVPLLQGCVCVSSHTGNVYFIRLY